jgi:hypothetical protein
MASVPRTSEMAYTIIATTMRVTKNAVRVIFLSVY